MASSTMAECQNVIEEDRISHLLDDVIEHIMEFLPARDAARTCVLSKKWRYVWANHPSLLLLDTKLCENIFRSILLHHVGRIRRLKVSLSLKGSMSHSNIDSCLSHLCRKGLKELFFFLGFFDKLYQVPCCVFLISTLTHLSLGFCTIKGNDNGVCLTNIQSLHLSYVTLDSCVVTAPLLTYLGLFKCSFILDFGIFAPKLTSLEFENDAYTSLKPFLACTGIDNAYLFSSFPCQRITSVDGESCLDLVNLLAAWPRLSKLVIGGLFFKYLATGSIPCILQLNNLTSLHLTHLNLDSGLIPWILCILKNSPLLHTFVIGISLDSKEEVIDIDETVIMELRMEQLRTIKMIYFRALRNEIMFVEILLKCAPSLEKMLVSDFCGDPNKRIHILKKLMLLQRAFPKPQIVYGRF